MPPLQAGAAVLDGRSWSPVDAGESGGLVFRSDGDAPLFLKYGSGRVADDIADEAARLRWLAGRIPCPQVRLFIAEDDTAWLVTSAIVGQTGDEWLEADPGAWPTVVRGAAAFLLRLHTLAPEDCPFEAGATFRLAAAARNVAEGRVPEDEFDADNLGLDAGAMLEKTRALLPQASERVVTHGDYSLGNLLFDARGFVRGMIDVGRLGLADPYQDIAIMWQNLSEFGAPAQRLLLEEIGRAEPDERRLTFHRYLDELF